MWLTFDVVIVGGGLAGLTLGIQLKQSRPETSVLIIERGAHPVPESAFKVGESAAVIATEYLKRLGLSEHLQKEQIAKGGIRMFFTRGDNSDISRRVEMGQSREFPVRGLQLDRGRLENHLGRRARELGVVFIDGLQVRDIERGDRNHSVTLEGGGASVIVRGRWLVDATGRVKLLRDWMGLGKKVDHKISAIWFRVAARLDVHDWSTDPDWQGRVRPGFRRLATCQLMGRGYWVWLIPLASEATSVGIVADPSIHPFAGFNTFERAIAWLRRQEPQCADEIESHRDKLLDFRVMKDVAYGCEEMISAERWCLTGEAGLFPDPLYSPGADLIAIGNSLITDLVQRDLEGQDIRARARAHNSLLLHLFQGILKLYRGQYPVMGSAQAWIAKAAWDSVTYWASYAWLFLAGHYGDPESMAEVALDLHRLNKLDANMQAFVHEWGLLDDREWNDAFVDVNRVRFMVELNGALREPVATAELGAAFSGKVDFCERLAVDIMRHAIASLGLHAPPSLDPYTSRITAPRPATEAHAYEGLNPAQKLDLDQLWLPAGRAEKSFDPESSGLSRVNRNAGLPPRQAPPPRPPARLASPKQLS